MSLIVAGQNAPAVALYGRLGYLERARRPVVAFAGFEHGGDWILMTRKTRV
jgi:ribosomal protein S18 acetylase RimI-like enzyme